MATIIQGFQKKKNLIIKGIQKFSKGSYAFKTRNGNPRFSKDAREF